jgi:hypothetical protein
MVTQSVLPTAKRIDYKKVFLWIFILYTVFSIADVVMTGIGLTHGGISEGNRIWHDHPVIFWMAIAKLFSIIFTAGLLKLGYWAGKKYPVVLPAAAIYFTAIISYFGIYTTIHNLIILWRIF